MKKDTIDIEEFLKVRNTCPVIDVRSPAEYNKAHIPGAFNIPLFTDEERALVGTKYVRVGRKEAVLAGLDAVGPKLKVYVETLSNISSSNDVLVYCWRGGLRSASLTWLFNLAGFKARALIGGYKSYRRYAQNYFNQPFKFIVLGGMTGNGKTELIKLLHNNQEQVVDLEGIANHKGSAFGWIGQNKQPSTEYFENLLFEDLLKLDDNRPIWLEDESKSIGSVFIPKPIFDLMAKSPTISVELPVDIRINRLVEDYTNCDPNNLIESVERISKRLGGDNAKKCVDFIKNRQFPEAIAMVLSYYDKTYNYGLSNKINKPRIVSLSENMVQNAKILLVEKDSIVF